MTPTVARNAVVALTLVMFTSAASAQHAELESDGELSNDAIAVPEGCDIEGLPDWWTNEDTAEVIERIGERLAQEYDPENLVTEAAINRAVENVASDIIAEKLAHREAFSDAVRNRLLREGKSPAQARRIQERMARTLKRQYRYNPAWMQRFNPLRKLENLRNLINRPKAWLRGRIGRALVRGLGSRILGFVGLAQDIYTIAEACYHGWEAYRSWEGAEEAFRECRELHRELERFRQSLTDEQKRQIQELYERERQYFDEGLNGKWNSRRGGEIFIWNGKGIFQKNDRLGRFAVQMKQGGRYEGRWWYPGSTRSGTLDFTLPHAGVTAIRGNWETETNSGDFEWTKMRPRILRCGFPEEVDIDGKSRVTTLGVFYFEDPNYDAERWRIEWKFDDQSWNENVHDFRDKSAGFQHFLHRVWSKNNSTLQPHLVRIRLTVLAEGGYNSQPYNFSYRLVGAE